MVTCPSCKSVNVKINDGNYARKQHEGELTARHEYSRYFFHCEQCGGQWESTQEAERDRLDYLWLRDRTTVVGGDLGGDGGYGPTRPINNGELKRRHELARKIVAFHRHLLDFDPAEWHALEMEAKELS